MGPDRLDARDVLLLPKPVGLDSGVMVSGHPTRRYLPSRIPGCQHIVTL